MNNGRRHILLSSVGLNPRETTYSLDGIEQTSRFSALGLWQLLRQEPRADEVWFVLTREAEENCWADIQTDAAELGLPVHPIVIPSDDADDTQVFLERTAEQIPEGCALTLDVTQGLRHHAFLFYALALYLSAFRSVTIEGVWYCRLEPASRDGAKPVIDLKPVLDLARWFHALAVFRETGSLKPVSQLIEGEEARSLVERLSFFYLNGMPLEAGDAATRLIEKADTTPLAAKVPLASELQRLILDELRPLAGPEFVANPKPGETSKKTVPLTEAELQRQAEFIRRYFESGQSNLAFGLLREWLVNWLALRRQTTTGWLDRETRESIERALGGLGIVQRNKRDHAPVRHLLTDQQQEWAQRWNSICDLRNALQHHGMKAAVFEPSRGDIRKSKADFMEHADWQTPENVGGSAGRLLICPIGLTPGVLYSAVTQVQPDRVLVVCSEKSAAEIEPAIAQSGRSVEVQSLIMADPYCGIGEFKSLKQQAAQWLLKADEVHANLTGGTTLMGVLVGELIKRASREYQRPLREFVLIDKRPPDQQRADPWQLGEIHYLDGQPPDPPSDVSGRHTTSGEASNAELQNSSGDKESRS